MRLIMAYFLAQHPTISFNSGEDIGELARKLFSDMLEADFKTVAEEMLKLKVKLPSFNLLKAKYDALRATAIAR